ncbi:MAG: metallophosphoesterase [Patescibacteria group bacterium]|nr:metallophosphoesterase [Patescibacteria group bacterium]
MPTYLIFAVFLAIAQALMLAVHYFIYGSIISLFGITVVSHKIALGIGLAVLAFSFLISSLLVRWMDTTVTKILYFLAGIWLGLLLYLVIGFLAAWLIAATWASFPRIILGGLAVAIALIVSSYGIWSSYHPKIKYLDVTLKNLPENWKGKTIVQLSDVHLGNVFGSSFLSEVVKRTNDLNPEVVLITGDLLDGMGDDLKHSVKPLSDIRTPQGMYFITGNHETFLPPEQVSEVLSQVPVKPLKNELVDLDGLQIIGINYPTSLTGGIDLSQEIKKINPDQNKPTILMYHSPVQVEAVSRTGVVDLMLSGHTHRGQMWPINLITYLIYHGYDYGLHQVGPMQIYTTTGTGGWGPTMRVFARPEIVAIRLR